jgi:2,4-dienoyl-CoA reductase
VRAQVLPIAMDVRDPAAVKAAADAVVKQFGTLPHIVVNNAAGNFIQVCAHEFMYTNVMYTQAACTQATERLSPNAFRNVVDIVLNGTFYVTLEFGRRLVAAEQACSFLAITTPYAHTGSPFVVPSACAKAGVETMTK